LSLKDEYLEKACKYALVSIYNLKTLSVIPNNT